jgi:hypothetical protein
MSELPCPACGSYADECDCCREHEAVTLQRALGLSIERPLTYWEQARARQIRIDNDNAALARAMREVGYR